MSRFTLGIIPLGICLASLALPCGLAWGQEPGGKERPKSDPKEEAALSEVVARVQAAGVEKGEEITARDVRRKLNDTFGSWQRIRKDALPRFQALALSQLIDQLLVLQSLERDKLGAAAEEIDEEFKDYEKSLPIKVAEDLAIRGHTVASFRRFQLAWEKSWKRHSARVITKEAMAEHFQKHRRELDGTELRVGHILFKPADPAVAADLDALIKKAQKVREEIASGATKFEDAVTAHSAGTKKDGGDLGFIRRQRSMPEAFAKAAFELQPGQISPPVIGTSGVHLIRCTGEKPGQLTLKNDEVADEVKLRLGRQLFESIASAERKKALADSSRPGIAFTGKGPYLKVDSSELVTPTP